MTVRWHLGNGSRLAGLLGLMHVPSQVQEGRPLPSRHLQHRAVQQGDLGEGEHHVVPTESLEASSHG